MTESEFGNYLKDLRINNKMTIHQLAEKSGISTSQISRIENGIRGIPKPETIQKLSEALSVHYDVMMAQAGYISKETAIELMRYDKLEIPIEWQNLIEGIRSDEKLLKSLSWNALESQENILLHKRKLLILLDDIDKIIYESDDPANVIRALVQRKKVEDNLKFMELALSDKSEENANGVDGYIPYSPQDMLRLPVLGSVRAGQPMDRIEHNEGYTLVDPELLRGRDGFALKVQGDSMSGDRILEGDIVIVLKQEEVQPHDIAVVAVDNDYATLKRVKQVGEMCMLIPSNPAMQPELVPCKNVRIIGKVVEVKFWPK